MFSESIIGYVLSGDTTDLLHLRDHIKLEITCREQKTTNPMLNPNVVNELASSETGDIRELINCLNRELAHRDSGAISRQPTAQKPMGAIPPEVRNGIESLSTHQFERLLSELKAEEVRRDFISKGAPSPDLTASQVNQIMETQQFDQEKRLQLAEQYGAIGKDHLKKKKPYRDVTPESHFNKLTPAEAERLALMAEECAETIQVIGKILRHGYESRHPDGGPTNREMLSTEIGHIDFARGLLVSRGDISVIDISESTLKKREKVNQYLHHNDA